MSHSQHLERAALFALVAGAALAGLAPAATADEAAGRVVAVRGTVMAQAPGEELRQLECNDPVFPGDRIVSSKGAALGILSDGIYSGLDESTKLDFSTTQSGAPDLSLVDGHLRMVDARGGERARIATPGLVAADAGTDTEAFAFGEKVGVVSMVCPWNDALAVHSAAGPEGIRAGVGSCAIHKPKEPLYVAGATEPRLGVLNDHCSPLPVAGAAAGRFGSPADVALGPPPVGAGPLLGPPIDAPFADDPRAPCDDPGACGGAPTPGPRPSPFPFIPPPTP